MNWPLNWLYKAKIKVTILVTFLIIAIVPVGAGLTSYFFTTRHSLEASAVKHLENLAIWESELVRDWFNQQMRTVRMLANSPEVKKRNLAGIKVIVERTRQYFPQFRNFAIVDNNGNLIYDTEGISDVNVSDRDYFKAAMRGEEYISEMLVARTFKRPCMILSVPVIEDGEIIGLVFGSVTVEELGNVMGFAIGKTGENFLIDRNGNLVSIPMSLQKAGVDPNKLIPAPKDLNLPDDFENNRVVNYKDSRKVDVISITRWLPDLKVLLVTKQDKSEALEDTGGWGLTLSLVVGNGLILLILPVIWFVAHRISRPLVNITTAVNEIASGNLSHRIEYVKANQEIELLAQQINDMASNMEESMKVNGEQLAELEAQKEEISAQNDELLRAYEQLSQANVGLQQLATTDQLTEIYNRRYFMDRLRREILISLRSKRALTILLIDIDYFKSVNDTYGHKSGDQVLKGLVQVVSENIRRSDLLARFGGEEFIVLAPETKLQGGIVLAEKIRTAIDRHDFEIEGGTIEITVSIGLAELNDFTGSPQKTEDQLLIIADKHLYEAKRNGRNRVEGGLKQSDAI